MNPGTVPFLSTPKLKMTLAVPSPVSFLRRRMPLDPSFEQGSALLEAAGTCVGQPGFCFGGWTLRNFLGGRWWKKDFTSS